jgi:hypothetical protein
MKIIAAYGILGVNYSKYPQVVYRSLQARVTNKLCMCVCYMCVSVSL